MSGPGRPSLPADVKAKRGTLRPSREPRVSNPSAPKPGPATTKDYAAIAAGYVEDVLRGRIVAGQWLIKAVERFDRMRRQAGTPGVSYSYSADHVRSVCSFTESLPHVEGKWSTATIELMPWQVWLLAACYGFRRANGRRLVTTVFFQVARKNAKSTLVAATALYHLAAEKEPGAQVICGATTGQQARIVFGIAQRMIRRSAWLRSLGFTAWAHAITYRDDATMKPINAKSSSQDGLSPSFISLDESHAQSFELHDVLKSAQGARPDAMLWCPTTAGYDMTSIGFALRSAAMKILDRVIDSDHTFCALYELDEADDWRDESAWIKAAPMLGITPTLDYLRQYRDDAIATPGLQGEFETKVCNRWLHAANRWLSMAAWDRCADPSLTLDAFVGERCTIGVDLAERDDIAAVALCFRRGDALCVFVKGYLPAQVVADRSRAVPEYRAWVNSGELVTTPGNMTDYTVIETDLRALCDRFDVQALVIERYGALNLAANLSSSGLPAEIATKNAKTFTEPAKELEARIKARRFAHNGSSFLKWQASNVCVERRRDGSLLPTKEAAESPNKIDGIDAVLLAMGATISQPAVEAPTIRAWAV